MVTRATRTGKSHYGQKSLIIALVAIILIVAGYYTDNTNLQWAAGAVFVLSTWYGVMCFFEYVDRT